MRQLTLCQKAIMNKEQFSILYNRFKSSGLTISNFSANEGYHKSSFYYWNKKYLQATATPELARITITPPAKREYHRRTATGVIKSGTTSHFGAGQKMIIEIKHPNGLEIRLRGDIDPAVLGTILNQFQ